MSTGSARPVGASGPTGRRRELDELLDGLADVTDGHGRVFLISGEAGIGKTTLAEALTDHARSVGAAAAWGRCWEGGGAQAYWSWTQVLRTVLKLPAGRRALDEIGADAGQVARIVPELASRHAPRDSGRFALFDAVTRVLTAAARETPVMIVQDDLHAADEASLRLLRFVVRELRDSRLLVVGTFRELEARRSPVAPLVSELATDARSIPLRGLDVTATETLVESIAGQGHPDLARSLHQITGGNPFFVRELLRVGTATSAADLRVPRSVRDTLRHRIDLVVGRLPVADSSILRQMLDVAAVVGHDVRRSVLEDACGRPPGTLLDALDTAVEAGLLTADGADHYQFVHALVREVLYQELSSARRSQLHAVVADSIERLGAEQLDEHAAERAHHLLAAGSAADHGLAVRAAREAGDRANRQLAYEEAARWYDRAVTVADSDDLCCDLLTAAGAAKARSGQPEPARDDLHRAVRLARRLGDPLRLAAAVFELGGLLEWGAEDTAYVELAEEVLGQLHDEVARVQVLGRLAAALRFGSRREYRQSIADQAVGIARQLADPALLAYALDTRLYAIWAPDVVDEMAAAGAEIVELAAMAGDHQLRFQGHMWCLIAHFEMGNIADVATDIEWLTSLAERLREPRLRLVATSRQAAWRNFIGDYGEGERLARAAYAIGRRAEDPEAFSVLVDQIVTPLWDQGRLREVNEFLPAVEAEVRAAGPTWRGALVLYLLMAGRTDEARAMLESFSQAELVRMMDRLEFFGLAVPAVLGFAACATGSGHLIDWLYERLRPYETRNVVIAGAVTSLGCVARYLGLLAMAMGRHELAEQHFEVALERHREWGARAWLVHTQLDYARLLRTRGHPDDLRRADDLQAEAATNADMVGMVRAAAQSRTPRAEASQPTSDVDELRRDGDSWVIGYEGRVSRVKDAKGMRYLCYLLAQPEVDVHVLKLAGTTVVETTDEPVLDEQARRAYRARLGELADELAEAQANHDLGRAEQLGDEIAFVERELSAAVGLGGRNRALASQAERARVAVTKAIRRAIAAIAEQDGALGRYLNLTIRTGRFCRYTTPAGLAPWRPNVRR